jgi:hypothetical protein
MGADRGGGCEAIKDDSKTPGPLPIYSLYAYTHPFLSLQNDAAIDDR